MPTITIPKETVDTPFGAGGGRFTWPTGPYRGTIRETRVKPHEGNANADTPWAGFETFDVVQIGLELAPVEPLDDLDGEVAAEIGQRPYFLDLTIEDGPHTLDNIDPTERDVDHWQLQRSLRYVAKLAAALGQTVEVGDDYQIADDFVDLLQVGEFNGQSFGFEVDHRSWTDQNGDKQTRDFVKEIFPA